METNNSKNDKVLIFRPYIIRDGKVIYPKKAKAFPLWVKP